MKSNAMEKFMSRMFRRAEGVVWDLSTGAVGIQTDDGIATLKGAGEDACIDVNLFDQFSIELPAFAQSTPLADVKIGDMIYFGAKDRNVGWVTERIEKKPTAAQAAKGAAPVVSFKLLKPTGETSSWKPVNVRMIGFGDGGANGVMVIRSLGNMLTNASGNGSLGGFQGSMMQMMQMQAMMGGGDLDMESLMPMMLMQQSGGGGGDMFQLMMMAKMFSGGENPMSKMFGNKGTNPFSKG